jgi:hypothetical protein
MRTRLPFLRAANGGGERLVELDDRLGDARVDQGVVFDQVNPVSVLHEGTVETDRELVGARQDVVTAEADGELNLASLTLVHF